MQLTEGRSLLKLLAGHPFYHPDAILPDGESRVNDGR